MRIIHLSDLHLTTDEKHRNNQNAWRLAEHIISKYATAPGETVVVATGDLTDNALEDERRALIALLALLRMHFIVLCCPGNHDYACRGIDFTPESVPLFRKVVRMDAPPIVWQSEHEPITFIGLDSADPQDNVWVARGIIGKQQLAGLNRLLDLHKKRGRVVVVYLHHHPIVHKVGCALKDNIALMNRMKGRVAACLFGHNHESGAYIDQFDGLPLLLASGMSTEPDQNNNLSYRVILTHGGRVEQGVYTETIRGT
ncbi:MAG: metallophosphoesterase [Deltaproteobacteria bacterium]|nr:metallophosphoesterase [Deltaproteobacteria bacterium]